MKMKNLFLENTETKLDWGRYKFMPVKAYNKSSAQRV